MLSNRDLQILLDDEKKEFSIKTSYSSTGPGYLNPWLLLKKQKNIWQHIEPVQIGSNRKVIVCEPFMGHVATQPFAIAFIAALVEHYEVYLWPGANKALQAVRPVASPEEFWELKPQANTATQAEVEDSLALQGLNTAQYLVIDHHAYGAILDRWHEKFTNHQHFNQLNIKSTKNHDRFTLDLCRTPFTDIAEIAKHVVTTEIKTIITYPLNKTEIETLMRLFAKLEKLVFKHATPDWVNKTLNTNYGLNIELRKFRAKDSYMLPSFIDVDSLTLSLAPRSKVKSLTIEQGASVNKIKLVNFSDYECVNIDLSNLNMLAEIVFSKCYIKKLIIARDNQISSLSLEESELDGFKLSRFTALRHLKVINSRATPFQIGKSNGFLDGLAHMGIDWREAVPQLETIELLSRPSHFQSATINLARDAALRDIKAVGLLNLPITYPQHDFFSSSIENAPSANRVVRTDFEAWSMRDVNEDIDTDLDENTIYMRTWPNDKNKKNIGYLYQFPRLETASYRYMMIGKADIGSAHSALKIFSIFSYNKYLQLTFNFSQKPNLQKIRINTPGSLNTTVDLKDCHRLLHLNVNVGINPLTLLNLSDCTNLRTLSIRSNNADILNEMALTDLPEDCVVYIYKDTPIESFTNRIGNAASSLCRSLPSLPSCCPKCGNENDVPESSGSGSSGCCSCSKPVAITFFGLAGASVLGMGIYLVYCLISGLRPFGNDGNEPTQAPPINNQTNTDHPTTDSPGLSEMAKILIGVGAGAALLLVCAGVLAYRYREKLRQRFTRVQPENYDLSLYGAATVDGATMLFERDIRFNERFNFNFYTGRKIDFNHVRLHVQNTMTWRDRTLYFHTDISGKRLIRLPEPLLVTDTRSAVRDLMTSMRNRPDEALAYISGELKPGEMYPLPTLENIESEEDLLNVFSEQKDLINFYYIPGAQQIYFGLKNRSLQAKSTMVTIYYHLRRNLNYLSIPFIENSEGDEHVKENESIPVHDVRELLPPEVIDYAWKRLASIPALRFMIDRDLSIPQKLNRLIDYFRSSEVDALNPDPRHHIKLLFEIIAQNKGVCRHASMGFFTMARLLGVPVVIVTNRGYNKIGHRFCAIPVNIQGRLTYQRVDLTLPDNTPELSAHDVDLFIEILQEYINQHSNPEVLTMEDDSEAVKAAYQDYYQKFHQAVSIDPLTSIRPILAREKGSLAPLIELHHDETPLMVNDELVRQLMRHGIDTLSYHLYIHTPEDFLTFLSPDAIIEGRCVTVDEGPLLKILSTNQPCILVINWSNFTAAQIASFQSIIDAEPILTVGDKIIRLSANVIVIGLIHDSAAAGKAFLSRSKRWQLDANFFAETYFDLQPHINDEVEVDLHHRNAWQEDLFGEIVYQGTSTLLKVGALNRAIARKCPLKIYNPPEDESFTQCLHQINGERKILHNGSMIEIPMGVEIITAQKENALTADNIKLEIEDETTDLDKQRIYISINNLHELFKLLSINKNGMADTFVGGLLKQYDPSSQVIYLIGDIPKSYWQALVAYIQAHHRHTNFHLLIAYGARIEGVHEVAVIKPGIAATLSNRPWLTENTIISNDPDYITQQAASELSNPLVIYINAQTLFSDMIASMVHDDEHHRGFIYTEHGLLTALKSGQTVILSGEMSLTLYYQLQSLLSPEPHIQLNGRRQHVMGRLMAIMPASLKGILPCISSECQLTANDYLSLLSTLPSFTPTHFQQILSFFERLRKLPHRGPGRPPIPEINYQRLKMMLNALADASPLYEHNPVKALVNFHYPRHSEDQAYINVMAKFHFRNQDSTPTSFNKIRKLVRENNIQTIQSLKRNVWKILNCFNGESLIDLLDADLSCIDSTSPFPMLSSEKLLRLLTICQNASHEPDEIPHQKIMRITKHLALLRCASEKPDTRVIFLKGEPGIGKTFTARKLIGKYYEGEKGLLEYLNSKGGKFLWDEGNATKPGTMDFLIKALASESLLAYYKGSVYQLTKEHSLYITGNPENFPGRYFHQAIIDYAVVIYFDLPDNAFLLELTGKILPPHLQQYADTILYAYHLIKKFNPFFVTSIRDVENLTHRFRFLARDLSTHDDHRIRLALLDACTCEFSGSIRDINDRATFVSKLESHLGVKRTPEANSLIPITNTVAITSQKAYIVRAIQQNLEIRLEALMQVALDKAKQARPSPTLFSDKGKEELDASAECNISLKQIDIVEGDPGIGKSTLLRAIAEQYKASLPSRLASLRTQPQTRENLIRVSVIEAEIRRSIYEISVGSADCTVTMQQALREESLMIGDESNVDPLVEQQLIQCVSGVDENMEPVLRLGFRFLGSQNASSQPGRLDASHAVRNRSNFIYMDDFSHQEYEVFSKAANIPYHQQFVRAFMDICKLFPAANTRTFHVVLKSVKVELNESFKLPTHPVVINHDMERVMIFDDSETHVQTPFLRMK